MESIIKNYKGNGVPKIDIHVHYVPQCRYITSQPLLRAVPSCEGTGYYQMASAQGDIVGYESTYDEQ